MSSPDEIFSLIENIQKHPFLYNYTLPEYSRKDLTEYAWNDVAENMNLSVAECKDKWRNIRNCLLRDLKKAKNNKKPKRPYYLRESLQFLVPFIKSVPWANHGTDDDNNTDHECEEDYDPNNPSTSLSPEDRKRPMHDKPYVGYKIKRQCNHEAKTPMHHFMLSLLPEFDTMTEQQIRHFKIEVMLLIDKIKFSQDSDEDPLQATSNGYLKNEDSS